jgi:hypothetical protein
MTQYIFMNDRIKQRKPNGPVIVAQDDLHEVKTRESNEFELWHHGDKIGRIVFDPKGLKACKTHDVKAWVELDDLVTVSSAEDRKPRKPIAAEKKPGRSVFLAGDTGDGKDPRR